MDMYWYKTMNIVQSITIEKNLKWSHFHKQINIKSTCLFHILLHSDQNIMLNIKMTDNTYTSTLNK